ncbi:MAG: alpha/beta hydrolase [Ruminococcaceae bacterium]|nr:alpha/beta hydrolase [Oscillospiraceae bacterium]
MVFYIIAAILLLAFLTVAVCFLLVFYSPTRKKLGPDEYGIPKGKIYEEFSEDIIRWTKDIRNMPREMMSITSRDGLTLRGMYYEYEKGAPIEILFHGYRGYSERDLCGGVHRCFHLKRNALIVDHRASGISDGHIITFGIKERFDCIDWVNFAIDRFGKDTKIMITGISMGAATVMMALNEPLPENVVCALADCGYTSPKEIITKVLRDLHLPPCIFYPIIKLGAKIFGRFNLEEASAIQGVKSSSLPIFFVHGDEDSFVPCYMSERLYEASSSEHKRLVIVKGAGHGLAFPKDPDCYYAALSEFEEECQCFK